MSGPCADLNLLSPEHRAAFDALQKQNAAMVAELNGGLRESFQKKLDEYSADYTRKVFALERALEEERAVNASLRDKLNGAQGRVAELLRDLAQEKKNCATRIEAAMRTKSETVSMREVELRAENAKLLAYAQEAFAREQRARRVAEAVKEAAKRLKQTLVAEREARKRQPSPGSLYVTWTAPAAQPQPADVARQTHELAADVVRVLRLLDKDDAG